MVGLQETGRRALTGRPLDVDGLAVLPQDVHLFCLPKWYMVYDIL